MSEQKAPANATAQPRCPTCGGEAEQVRVRLPYLNEEQEASLTPPFTHFCRVCPANTERFNFHYFNVVDGKQSPQVSEAAGQDDCCGKGPICGMEPECPQQRGDDPEQLLERLADAAAGARAARLLGEETQQADESFNAAFDAALDYMRSANVCYCGLGAPHVEGGPGCRKYPNWKMTDEGLETPEGTFTARPRCELCGEPMPAGEESFKYHGYSGPCPKPPLVGRSEGRGQRDPISLVPNGPLYDLVFAYEAVLSEMRRMHSASRSLLASWVSRLDSARDEFVQPRPADSEAGGYDAETLDDIQGRLLNIARDGDLEQIDRSTALRAYNAIEALRNAQAFEAGGQGELKCLTLEAVHEIIIDWWNKSLEDGEADIIDLAKRIVEL